MNIAVLIFVLLLSTTWLVLSTVNFISLLRDKVPYVATPDWVQKWLAENIPLQNGMTVYDLGCGDGRVLRSLLAKKPLATAVGYERNWWPYCKALWLNRGKPITMLRKNFYHANLRNADIVYCYLMPVVMPKVERLLRAQLKPGSVVCVYAFPMPAWQPEQIIPNPNQKQKSVLYIYRA